MQLTYAISSPLYFLWLHFFGMEINFCPHFSSPPVPLGVMLDAQPYVETSDSVFSP